MTRHPYGPDELDREDATLDRVAERLESYASRRSAEPPADLAARIMATIDDEPAPRAGWWASVSAGLRAWRAAARALAVTAILVAAVVGAVAIGELAERVRQENVGSSPGLVPSSPSPSPTLTPTPSPSPSPSLSPSPSPVPSPSASDDDEVETPEPSGSDDSGSDDSGSGSGNSGSGSGDGD
jgi:hypothetical protein